MDSPWPALSKGGRERWVTRLNALNPRIAALAGRPALVLRDAPGRATPVKEREFTWLEVDLTWLHHRAHMQGADVRSMRAVAAYVLATLYAQAGGLPLTDPFAGLVLAELRLPLAPAQTFAASLNPLDPLRSNVPADLRLTALTTAYGAASSTRSRS
ncbi:MAG: hypothetical protein H6737_12345 [Alphaproteobacteria bacterium]|nr:hypothetical protein [Alphaproteobacteria bacterium]